MVYISLNDVKAPLRGGNKMTSLEIEEAIRKAKKISKDMWDEISPLPFLMILRRLHELGQINQLQTDYRGRTSTIEYSLSSNVFEPAEDESDDNREEVVDDPNRTPTTK